MTCRQLFYRLVAAGAIDKTEAEYKATVVRLLGVMRRQGDIPFDWIADNTRWRRKPRSHHSLIDALQDTADFYRRALWASQSDHVELWLEKDALASALWEVTSSWDVPLMVSRGYASITYLYNAAEDIQQEGKPCYIYHFGDHDPSGRNIGRAVEECIREFAPEVEIYFERVAVTPEQIQKWDLPTRPTKTTDSRSRDFVGESVDVDVIPPAQLRQLALSSTFALFEGHS